MTLKNILFDFFISKRLTLTFTKKWKKKNQNQNFLHDFHSNVMQHIFIHSESCENSFGKVFLILSVQHKFFEKKLQARVLSVEQSTAETILMKKLL